MACSISFCTIARMPLVSRSPQYYSPSAHLGSQFLGFQKKLQRGRPTMRLRPSTGLRIVCWFKFGKNGVDAENAGIYGSQGRDDFDRDDVEQFSPFHASGPASPAPPAESPPSLSPPADSPATSPPSSASSTRSRSSTSPTTISPPSSPALSSTPPVWSPSTSPSQIASLAGLLHLDLSSNLLNGSRPPRLASNVFFVGLSTTESQRIKPL